MRCPEEHPVFQASIRWGELGGIHIPRVPITHIRVSQTLLEESAQAEENSILRARCGKPRHNPFHVPSIAQCHGWAFTIYLAIYTGRR